MHSVSSIFEEFFLKEKPNLDPISIKEFITQLQKKYEWICKVSSTVSFENERRLYRDIQEKLILIPRHTIIEIEIISRNENMTTSRNYIQSREKYVITLCECNNSLSVCQNGNPIIENFEETF